MVKENTFTEVASIDDNDNLRGVTEEGVSVQVPASVIKTYAGEGTATPYIDVVNVGDDKGLIFTEQISVGSPDSPKESVFGEGDSYGVGLEDATPDGTPKVGSAWHLDQTNVSGMTITGATDITEELSSDSGSTTGLFGGSAVGKTILIGSDYKYGGAKAKMDTLGTVEPNNVTAEYLAATNTWVNAPYMATDSGFPYTQKGHHIASCSSCSEQWRFGFNPLDLPTTWAKVALTINGTVYTKYWAWFRFTTEITLDPIMEQIKLHTNRYEINAEGVTEYFGRSRYPKTLLFGLHNTVPNANNDPANENVDYGTNFRAKYLDNEFANGTTDGFGIVQNIEEGLDTSIPLQLTVSYYVKGTNTGDVEFNAEVFSVEDGFIYDGNATPDEYSVIDTISTDSNEVRRSATMLIPINKLTPKDAIVVSLYRDATSGNTNDTLASNIVMTNVVLTGYSWRP